VAYSFVHGKLGLVSIGGTNFATLQFSFREFLSDLSDITYTVAGGATYGVKIPGYNMCSGTLTFIYDTLNQPVLSPQNMIPGTSMSLILYPDGTKPYTITAYSAEFNFASGPKSGPVNCTANFESTGSYSRPAS